MPYAHCTHSYMKLQLLGTGNAAQVPVYNCGCAACERARREPVRRRGPCSALVESEAGRWLIDAGMPDLTDRFPPGSLSGIIQTHYHADHAQGLLSLRWGKGLCIPVLGPPDPEGLADLYRHPGILDFSTTLQPFQTLALEGMRLTALPLIHSKPTYGYLFEEGTTRIAYLTDTVGLPADTRAYLAHRPLDLLVLDCSFPPMPELPRNHNDMTRALQTARSLLPARTVLTHIGHDLDAWLMDAGAHLPEGVVVGGDGEVVFG